MTPADAAVIAAIGSLVGVAIAAAAKASRAKALRPVRVPVRKSERDAAALRS